MAQVTIVQPVVPHYRQALFDRLARRLGSKFRVFASAKDFGALTADDTCPAWEKRIGRIRSLPGGLEWQAGALGIDVRRGDILVVSGAPRCLSNLGLLMKGRMAGASVIWWGHFRSSTSRNWSARLRLSMMGVADGVLFYTEREIEEYLAFRGGPSRQPLFALNNGIDTTEINSLREPYAAASRLPRILFIGRITEKANLPLLLRALAMEACREIGLDIVGGGEGEREAREVAEGLDLGRRIVWHGATVDEERVAQIANNCRMFVYPGSVGLSLIHGLAYGLPAVVHNDRWTHMPEIAALRPGGNGLTFLPNSAKELAHVLSHAIWDLERLDAMAVEAINTTARSFNVEDMTERFLVAIEAMSSGSMGGGSFGAAEP